MTPGELRARLRPLATNERDRFCGVKASSLYPRIEVRHGAAGNQARFKGVMLCGHIWTCPVCSRVLRAERGKRISAAVRGAGGRWQMLTLTIRHRGGGDLRDQIRALASSWRRCKQGGSMQKVWSRIVRATVRATEVTYSRANGWHPHIHVLARLGKCETWTRSDRDALFARWRDAVVDELGPQAEPTAQRGLHFTREFDASVAPAHYLTKLGLELSNQGKEGRRPGSVSTWRLAELAAEGDESARRLWHAYVTSTKGHQMIRLDDRAQEHARWWLFCNAVATDGEGEPARVTDVELWPEEVAVLRRGECFQPSLVDDVLRGCETESDARAEVARWVSWSAKVSTPNPGAEPGP